MWVRALERITGGYRGTLGNPKDRRAGLTGRGL